VYVQGLRLACRAQHARHSWSIAPELDVPVNPEPTRVQMRTTPFSCHGTPCVPGGQAGRQAGPGPG
jgi:hypothetical protein